MGLWVSTTKHSRLKASEGLKLIRLNDAKGERKVNNVQSDECQDLQLLNVHKIWQIDFSACSSLPAEVSDTLYFLRGIHTS